MKTAIECLELNGFDFAAFEYENEYSARNILLAMEEYASQQPQHTEVGNVWQWVKADKTNPDKEGYFIVLNTGRPEYPYECRPAVHFWYNDIKEWSSKTEYWLSQTPLPEHTEVGGWISVEDGLPKYNQRVIVYKSYHDIIEIAIRLKTDNTGENWSCEYSHYVTHWQPLPQPPKQ